MIKELNRWFVCPEQKPEAKTRLFCLPFAGGGASFYQRWSNALSDDIEILAVQLPGRETRLKEPRITDAGELAGSIALAMEPYLDRPYAVFGCSLGALMAFEVVRTLRRSGKQLPMHLFATSARAPQAPPVHPPIAGLPREEFVEMINHYYQPEDEVWKIPEMLDIFLPVLRDDISIVDNYQYTDEPVLSCPIDVFVGAADLGAPLSSVGEWRQQTSAQFEMTVFNGGHFFFYQSLSDIQSIISQRMQRLQTA